MQLIFSVCMLFSALYELLQTYIWCDSWSCSCLVCTPHLLQQERNVRSLWGALPSKQEHWVISPNSAFPEMLTCPPFTLPKWYISPQADVGMWQKCVLRFVWWGCSASTLTACFCRNKTVLCNILMPLEAFKIVCIFSLYQTVLLFILSKLHFFFCRAFPSFSSFASAFCRHEGAHTQVFPGFLSDWQTMKDLVISFSCFFASEWLNSLCRSTPPQPKGVHLLSMPF